MSVRPLLHLPEKFASAQFCLNLESAELASSGTCAYQISAKSVTCFKVLGGGANTNKRLTDLGYGDLVL